MYQFLFGFGNSFIFLAFIDTFDFGTSGILIAVVFTAQFLTDYPTGSLSDYIGQRFVIALSMLFLGIGYFLIAMYNGLVVYFVAALLFGMGMGQLSGSFESFLDNNYKIIMNGEDTDRKIYGFMYQRMGITGALFMSVSFVIGGFISSTFSRNILFELQSLLLIIFIPLFIFYLKDTKSDSPIMDDPHKPSYFSLFKGGFSFLLSSRKILSLFIGLAIIMAADGVWGSLMLFPFYYGYTGSDAGVGTFRAIIFVVGAILIIYISRFNKKISSSQLGKFGFLYSFTYFTSAMLILAFLPINNTFNILGCILVLLMMTFSNNLIGSLFFTLSQRVLSVTVPSEQRNSIYSLLPSIALILQIPLLPIVGNIVQKSGMVIGAGILLVMTFIGSGFIYLFHYYDNKQEVLNQTKSILSSSLEIPVTE